MASKSLGDVKIRVLVAEDSRIYTRLLCDALQRDPSLDVAPFESQTQNLSSAIQAQQTEILILSSSLEGEANRAFALLRDLRLTYPGLKTLILLDSNDDASILNAFRSGARGIFSKRDPIDLLSRCIHCLYDGQVWANSRQINVIFEALTSAPVLRAVNAKGASLLSKREVQIVRCLAEGMTNQEIADRLKLSRHTVKNYLFRMFDKLGVSSRIELLFMTMAQTGIPIESAVRSENLSAESGQTKATMPGCGLMAEEDAEADRTK